jgi:hypothetical protein
LRSGERVERTVMADQLQTAEDAEHAETAAETTKALLGVVSAMFPRSSANSAVCGCRSQPFV